MSSVHKKTITTVYTATATTSTITIITTPNTDVFNTTITTTNYWY